MNKIQKMPSTTERPYRSHKIRACDYCRRRKQRCMVEAIGKPCRLCEQQGISCRYTRGVRLPPSLGSNTSSSVARVAPSLRWPKSPSSQACLTPPTIIPSSHNDDTETPKDNEIAMVTSSQSTHIVGPVVSEDAHVLEQYMSPAYPEARLPTRNPFNVYSADPEMPVLYTKVERRRLGLATSQEPGIKQKNIMDQILATNRRTLIDTYLTKIDSCFPVIDRRKVSKIVTDDDDHCSATLLCGIYATTLCFWSQTDVAVKGPCPDQRFAWNLAVEALQEDFLAPNMSTLQAVLVDLTGRPIYSLTGNVINNGRAVALANSLGLNRNPDKWNILNEEKCLRIRIWWGVLIHDTWGCFAHGTPPNINPSYHDTPVPTLHDLTTPDGDRMDQRGAECFIALCRLTDLLGKMLPLAYGLQAKSFKDIRKIVRAVEIALDQWEHDLPDYLQEGSTYNEHVSGSSSLHLGFLSLKMLVCRISLHGIRCSGVEDNSIESLSYYQLECRMSALAIVKFISSLKNLQLAEFWLPYSAYFLTSAITLLLRFAVQATDHNVATSCASSVREFICYLRHVQEQYGWDLGSHCLAQCEGIVERMTHCRNSAEQSVVEEEDPQALFPDFDWENPVDWLDSSLPISFGQMGKTGQARDLWDLIDMDTLLAGHHELLT